MSIRIDGTNTTANPGITGGDVDTGLQFGTDEVSIVTGGTDRVTVDSSGNVDIGSGNIALNADGSATFSGDVQTGDQLLLPAITGTTQEAFSVSRGSGATLDHTAVRINYLYTSSTSPFAITLQNTGAGTASTMYEINENGDHLIGGTLPASPNITLNAGGSAYFAGTIQAPGLNRSASAGSALKMIGDQITVDTSSIRFKKDVEDIEESYAVNVLKNARPVWFRSKHDSDDSSHSYWGFIAEEIAAVEPRLCDFEDGEPYSVEYAKFSPILLKLIQMQEQRIEALEAKLAALEGGTN